MKQEIQIPVEAFKNILPGINKVVSRHSTLPILGCIHLKSGPNGLASARVTNLDDYVTVQFHSTPGRGEFDGLVPLESLAKLIKGFASHDLVTLAIEKEELKLSHAIGPTMVSHPLEYFPVDQFPVTPEFTPSDSVIVGPEFKEALKAAFESTGDDESRYILNHAYVDVSEPNAHYLVGTNGRQLYSANSFQLALKESLIFPKRKFLLWSGFVEDGEWRISLGPVIPRKKEEVPTLYVQVQSDRWTLVTRQVEGNYPNWRQVLPHPDQEKTIIRFNQEAADFICRAAPQLPGTEVLNQGLLVQVVEGGSVFLEGKSKSQSASVPVIGAVTEGRANRVTINRQYLVKAMKMGLSQMEILDSINPVVFQNEGKRLVIAPLRDDVSPPPVGSANTPAPIPDQSSSPEPAIHSNQEPKTEMKTINRIPTVQTTTEEETNAPAPSSAFLQVKEQIERVKETLRGVVSDLNETARLLANAQKEKKATEKEIESVRATLRSLQRVQI